MKFVFLFLILLNGILFSQNGGETYPDAVQALQNKDYFGAQVIAERLLEETPGDPKIWRVLGESLYYQKRYIQAVEVYEKLEELGALEKEDGLIFANTLITLKEYERASAILEELAEETNDIEALYLLGRVKLELGEGDVAIDFLNRAYLIDPKKAPEDFDDLKQRSLEIRASSLQRKAEERAKAKEARLDEAEKKGDLTEAEKTNLSFKRRKQITRDKFTPFSTVDKTEKELEMLRIFDPVPSRREEIDETLLENFDDANSLFSEKLFDKAITNYDAIVQQDTSFFEAFYQKGMALYASGDYRSAIIEFDKVIRLNKNFIRAMYWRASGYEKIGEIDKALDDYVVARKMALQMGDAFVLFDSSVRIAALVRRGANSKFLVEIDDEKVSPVEGTEANEEQTDTSTSEADETTTSGTQEESAIEQKSSTPKEEMQKDQTPSKPEPAKPADASQSEDAPALETDETANN